jgi:TRAP-type uncharacterized transport system substrate-binding protein
VAAGSFDGDAPKLMTAIASRLAATNAPVRLKVVEKATALDAADAFAKGQTDLAVVRGRWEDYRAEAENLLDKVLTQA